MAKTYSNETFKAVVNNKTYLFEAYTTHTRNGFCHTIVSLDYNVRDTKVSYYNRTWERFTYETALLKMIDKFPKSMRDELREQLVESKCREINERCKKQEEAFKNLHNKLSDKNKEILANSGIEMQSTEDVNAVMGIMGLMSVLG